MILKILLGMAAAFALFRTIKTKRIFPGMITVGMIVGTKPLAWQHGFTANICAFSICSGHYW